MFTDYSGFLNDMLDLNVTIPETEPDTDVSSVYTKVNLTFNIIANSDITDKISYSDLKDNLFADQNCKLLDCYFEFEYEGTEYKIHHNFFVIEWGDDGILFSISTASKPIYGITAFCVDNLDYASLAQYIPPR